MILLTLLLVPQLLGRFFLPGILTDWKNFTGLTRAVLCQAIGYLIQALLFLSYRVLFDSKPLPLCLTSLCFLVAWLRLWKPRVSVVLPSGSAPAERTRTPLLTGLLLQALGSAVVLVLHGVTHPLGNMDAYSHWMLRARFLSDAELWRRCFAPNLNSPEYPLLFPSAIASVTAGNVQWQAGATLWLEMVFVGAVGLILYEGIALLRGKRAAALGAAIYLSAPWVLYRASCLYADTVIGFLFALTTLVLISNFREHRTPRFSTLVGLGLVVGFAWLTKHEGVVFFVNVTIALVAWQGPRLLQLAAYALPCLGLASLHLLSRAFCVAALSIQSPLNFGLGSLGTKLMDPWRYLLVAKAILKFFFDFYWWNAATPALVIALGIWVGFKPVPRRLLIAFLPVLLQFVLMAAYFVVSPRNLEIHLVSAFPRLVLQTYPAILILVVGCWNVRGKEDSQIALGTGPDARV